MLFTTKDVINLGVQICMGTRNDTLYLGQRGEEAAIRQRRYKFYNLIWANRRFFPCHLRSACHLERRRGISISNHYLVATRDSIIHSLHLSVNIYIILIVVLFAVNKSHSLSVFDDYYALLNKVTTLKNWRELILYMLSTIEETSIFTINKINEIDSLFQKTCELVKLKLPHIRKEVIEKIFEQPYISPRKLLDQNTKSINTAKKYLGQLEGLGIMVSKKVGKEIIYLNIDLFNLLSEI